MRTHLIEPHSGGRISGGYLYNQRIADGCKAVARHAVGLDTLDADLARLELAGSGWVLIDSLFLQEELFPALLSLRRSDLRLGVLLHALPSFIERANRREVLERELPLTATPAELALLDELELLVAPGPYVPRVLGSQGSPIPCIVCPPGVDHRTSPPTPKHAKARAIRLISLGGVSPLKGFADGLAALARSGVTDWEWNIAGSLEVAPEHTAQLLALRRQLDMEDRVRFLGQLDHATTLELLGESDVLLVPSYTENAPLVALEALASGVPVVGYAVGGLPDIVRDGETGLLAPLLDIPALAERLHRIITDEAMRARLARAARDSGNAIPSWPEAAHHFADALDSASLTAAARSRTGA
jgi:glycosyltransferase involved in cell wall biosynthesis